MADKKLKILIYGINYYPELTGIGKYTGEMGAWFAKRGYDIDVITALPYYPEWRLNQQYKGKWWHKEKINGATILRCPLYIPQKVSGKTRIIHELSFLLSSLWYWLPRFFTKYDAIIAIYPPLVINIYPYIYSIFHKKTKVLIHIQDLQVDAAKQLNLIKNKALLNFLENAEKFFLKKATTVSSISNGMKQRILDKGINENNFFMLPNWAETEFLKPLPQNKSLRNELGFLPEDKLILYSGNIGEKQGIEILIPIAQYFKKDPLVKFIIAGEGASKQKLQQLITEKEITNILFLPLQPYNKLPIFLALADLHLVIQKKAAADLVLPSKLISILSCGGCAIVTAQKGSSLYQMIEEEKTAILIEPENEKALKLAIEEALKSNTTNIKVAARNYALNHLNIDKILFTLEVFLKSDKL